MEIRRVLKEAGLSMEKLARLSGLGSVTLRIWSSKARNPKPTPESLRKLAKGLRAHRDTLDALADAVDPDAPVDALVRGA